MRDGELRELEEDFFRRGDELGDASLDPDGDPADPDADAPPPRRRPRRRWRREYLAGVGGVAAVLGVGLVVARGIARPVHGQLACPAPPPCPAAVVTDQAASPPSIADPAASKPAPEASRRHRAPERARRPSREHPAPEPTVGTRSPIGSLEPERTSRIAPPPPRPAAEPPSKDARRQRAFGYHCQRRGLRQQAAQAFRNYLRLAPRASDAAEVRRLIDQLGG